MRFFWFDLAVLCKFVLFCAFHACTGSLSAGVGLLLYWVNLVPEWVFLSLVSTCFPELWTATWVLLAPALLLRVFPSIFPNSTHSSFYRSLLFESNYDPLYLLVHISSEFKILCSLFHHRMNACERLSHVFSFSTEKPPKRRESICCDILRSSYLTFCKFS